MHIKAGKPAQKSNFNTNMLSKLSKTGKFEAKFSFFMIYFEINFFNLPKL